ncbi:hypothetical protein GCM10023169_34070 [Georgenia halophila]|uniref:Uncharacterized protein n=1 Tax=Georgenia halophila TaxID=620889 RepID=A0ABP8LLG0_9MICO
MRCGKDRHLSFREKVLGVESGEVVERTMHECHVSVSCAQETCLLADLAQEHLNRCRTGCVGMCIEQGSQQLVGCSRLRREHKRPPRITGTPRAARGCSDRVESRCGLSAQDLTRFRECDAATVPIEEPDAETTLQLADRPRQRRLRNPESLGGPSEVQLLGHREVIAQLPSLQLPHQSSQPVIPHGYHS